MSSEGRGFPAVVAKVIDEYKLVINRGSRDGVSKGQTYIIYAVDENDVIIDPETQEELGVLEVIRGEGKVTHAQENFATIETNMRAPSKMVKHRHTGGLLSRGLISPTYYSASINPITEERIDGEFLPFEDPNVGDLAKPI